MNYIIFIGYFLDLCNRNFLCSHWQSSHHTFQDDDFVGTRVFTCQLLSSCDNPKSTTLEDPIVTNSGSRFCLPDPFRRRPCGGCPKHRPFCHGRCAFNRACFFVPCSKSPYKEDGGSTCSQLAIESEEKECGVSCAEIFSTIGASTCQACLVQSMPGKCQKMHGASCWYCSGSLLEEWRKCSISYKNPTDIIHCVQQDLIPGCRSCVCTLFCYWSAEEELCTYCLEQPESADLFANNEHCEQGWYWSQSTSKCYKAFTNFKPWNGALRFCQDGGGGLVQPKTNESFNTVLEAMNLRASSAEYWIGGIKDDGDDFLWAGDNSKVKNDNWAIGYPLPGKFLCLGCRF